MDKKFKIGDQVHEIFTGQDYEIIADKKTPYKHILEDIFPMDGNDFVLKKLKIEPGKFEPFVHAPEQHLEEINK